MSGDITSKPLFNSVLVANRGEIAVRIISTLKKLGIRSVAIYSQEDRKSQHVHDSDYSFLLPGNTVESTYLSGDEIIKIARVSGVEAIIPGYGFLSESAEFAEDCEKNGLVWIGPTPEQMRKLSLKHLARQMAQETGIPLLPGTGAVENVEAAVAKAEDIGYPVMVKCSAGGGGIAITRCADPEMLRKEFDKVRHLGQAYFKDDTVFIEKFVESARHIEVQIIGDGEGLVKHMGERDCSLQRRQQKVIEETPAVFVPEKIRKEMQEAAIKLATGVKYRGVGTVEFLYNLKTSSFFFLEVNTRLQVEHPVTEEVTGIDVVEAMIRIAAHDSSYLFGSSDGYPAQRVAIEARICGESPLQNFRPAPGQLLEVSFPDGVRVDTYIKSGTLISASYDPLIAKLIVSGNDRAEAVQRLSAALCATRLSGIETNLEYLRQIVCSSEFQNGTYTTTSLNTFKYQVLAFEVVEPGPSTTIQDFPGRLGFWHVGIPPSGPMDNYAFRLANRILGNDLGAAALECNFAGPTLLFHHDAHVTVVGGSAVLQIDGVDAPLYQALKIHTGQILKLGTLESGCRAYIAVKGGILVPEVFGSRSTFSLGKIGGHCGRELRVGDIVHFDESASEAPQAKNNVHGIVPSYGSPWVVKVMPGPHAFPDFFLEESFAEFFTTSWKVHYNSNRVGVRLTGPKPKWARSCGGEAGLHPSNIHDSPYSIGAISFTGDEAVILTCDGPSLGGFVIFATVITAEMWKIGQMKPGDEIVLTPVTAAEAMILNANLHKSIENLTSLSPPVSKGLVSNPILGDIGDHNQKILCRQTGDNAMLLEFGDNNFDIRGNFRIYGIIHGHAKTPIQGILELTPGVRTLLVFYKSSISQEEILSTLKVAISSFSSKFIDKGIPSRTFHLPLAFEHLSSLAAVERYSQTIREDAPWLPNNVEFLQRINGLEAQQDVKKIILGATFLVLGLGDVFFGSPCAIPLDPRHRLFGMKYNPSRSFTPEGTVGVGGQYLCIYGIESPGGYQLVGRTVPIWNRWAKDEKAWKFNIFDRIRFYPVSEEVLDAMRENEKGEKLVIVTHGNFGLHEYESWLHTYRADIKEVTSKRSKALLESDAVAEALRPSAPPNYVATPSSGESMSEGGVVVRAGVAGKCWRSAVKVGDIVHKGQTLVAFTSIRAKRNLTNVSA
jgi:urea carboxylase